MQVTQNGMVVCHNEPIVLCGMNDSFPFLKDINDIADILRQITFIHKFCTFTYLFSFI